MNKNNTFSNYNIWKYCSKYFFLTVIGAYTFNTCTNLINQKNDVANLIGSALFAGLFIGTLLILKSDVTKLVKTFKEDKTNE